jgi:hypothetical protein
MSSPKSRRQFLLTGALSLVLASCATNLDKFSEESVFQVASLTKPLIAVLVAMGQ